MTWAEVRALCPEQWVLIETIDAITEKGRRIIPNMKLIAACTDWDVIWQHYKDLHAKDKWVEYLVVHTSNQELNIGVIDALGRIVKE